MILVTGGTGFLGRNLVPTLVREGYPVRALVRDPARADWMRALGVEVAPGVVEDAAAVGDAMAGCRWVVHAAGRFRFWGRQDQFEQTNVAGAQHVMAAAARAGVEQFIHISTVVVIGNPIPGQVIDEDHPANPVDPYQKSKLRGEEAARAFYRREGLPVVILRPGAFYGPWGRYAFNRLFFEDPLKGNLVQVKGGRLHTFPAYIEDVAEAVALALAHARPGETYNICGDCLTHREANVIVSEAAGITRMRVNVPEWALVALASALTRLARYTQREPYYPINMYSYVFNDWRVSSAKARRELGFTPTPFREGVQRTLAWYQETGILRRRWRALALAASLAGRGAAPVS